MIEFSVNEIVTKYKLSTDSKDNRKINNYGSLVNQDFYSISWIKNEKYIEQIEKGIFIVSDLLDVESSSDVIILKTSQSPKLIFSKILQDYFSKSLEYYLENDVESHRNNKFLKISDHVFIGQNVSIGNGTTIMSNSVIEADTIIGKNCLIKPLTSIGTEGVGFEKDEASNTLIKFPQLGNVVIEDNVELGPNSTVRRGALKSTLIKNGAKIGSLCNVGHNCIVGVNSFLASNVCIAGSSVIGDNVFVGVQVGVRNGVTVGNDVTIGMASVVLSNIEDGVTVIGCPAKVISKN